MPKILNIGSVNIDFVYSVPHFVRPGETLASTALEIFPGGKGMNQSVALARAGAKVFHAGRIGSDGAAMAKVLEDAGVDTRYLARDAAATGNAIIQVDEQGQNCIILFAGANGQLEEEKLEAAIGQFAPGDWLLMQNETNGAARLMTYAHEKGLRVAYNPSPITPALAGYPLHLVDLFFVNEVEGQALTGESQEDSILQKMRALYPKAAIVLTLGGDGAACALPDGTVLRQPVYPAVAVDTTAAGDTFTGYFLTAYAAGEDAALALKMAARASSLAVAKMGAAESIPSKEAVLSAGL